MRSAGIQVEALIEYVELFQLGEDTSAARKQILLEQREQLIKRMGDMQETLERLNKKIERYEQCRGFLRKRSLSTQNKMKAPDYSGSF